jgi:FolB domain-containing protein
MTIKIKNLRLRTIVGVYEWERQHKQEVVVNIQVDFDGEQAAQSDRLEDTVDYKALKGRILEAVENSQFFLLERLAGRVLEIVMDEPRVQQASVEVDKPHALRFADSVSVQCQGSRKR